MLYGAKIACYQITFVKVLQWYLLYLAIEICKLECDLCLEISPVTKDMQSQMRQLYY